MMGKVIMSGIVPQLVAPVTGIALADIAEGSIVKLNENGSPVEFYVAKHNYESGLNGPGRTLLARRFSYGSIAWSSSRVNAYASGKLDSWYNGTCKEKFDADVQNAMGTTKFYYTPGNGSNSVSILARSIFTLSLAELGLSGTYANAEGSVLPTASSLRVLYTKNAFTGVLSVTTQATRTPITNSTSHFCYVKTDGALATSYADNAMCGNRSCFTLPATAMFDEETLLFKGVS